MSSEPSTQLVDADGLRESLAEICASQEEFRRFFSGVFSELDHLSAKLVQRQQVWLSEQRQTAGALERQAAAVGAENNRQLQRMLEEAERERTALQIALEATQTHSDRLAQVTDELSQARLELAQARQEIERLHDDLENVRNEPASSAPDEELQNRLQQMRQERTRLDQERLVLESELDTVRNRAAELAETLAEQRRQTAEERQQWAQELKRMRHLLETLSVRQAEHQAASGSQQPCVDFQATAAAPPDPVSAPAADDDPALDSVMAQFEMLQKDIVRRRKSKAGCN